MRLFAVSITRVSRESCCPRYFLPFPALTTFDIIVGCLRLSHKYEVDYLRRRALIHLSSRYRTTLAEFDSSSSGDSSRGQRPSETIVSWPISHKARTGFYIYAIHLAREVDALWVLPHAFYCLSSCFPNVIAGEISSGGVYDGAPTTLSVQDEGSFLQGHAIQTRAATKDIAKIFTRHLDIKGCSSQLNCYRVRLQAIEDSREMIHDSSPTPLNIQGEVDDLESLLWHLCPKCLNLLKRAHAEARQKLWDALPSMYQLPSWAELKKMKVAAIGNSLLC
ncbi:hypothetical protein B0H17DRAFT_1065969 [Mycena rosella]|uniref:Uncharacterized protein n=1 Tax=Mycena rosella TaxID=1033263 RepID=A0AAD7DF56_MYCRO|nr:hypothetical protein B0H17DRAFT_1065969 [Mycena rosella]